jgi:hypothetical protein
MTKRILFFVAGIAPTPDEAKLIFALCDAGKEVECLSLQTMDVNAAPKHDMAEIESLQGEVPANYADAFKAANPQPATASESPFAEVGKRAAKNAAKE